MKPKPLWKCPKCGERFTGKNMWHSCGKFSLDDLFARSEPRVRRIFRKFQRLVSSSGPVHMIPQKSRVVFQTRMRFTGCMPRKSHLICHFLLPRRVKNPRFHKIETFNDHCHAHYMRVRSENELDAEVLRWIKTAHEVGNQKHLSPRA